MVFSTESMLIFIVLLTETTFFVESSCSDDQFLCTDGKCITNDWVCDGARDCADGSDEHHEACDRHLNTNSPCFGNQPECEKHGLTRCIPHEWLCDGHPDCDAGEDELNCTVIQWFRQPESLMHKYQKESSLVVLLSQNRSSKNCQNSEFSCKTSSKCINSTAVCNGVKDCEDASDEAGCPDPSPKITIESKSASKESETSKQPKDITSKTSTTTATISTTAQPKIKKISNVSDVLSDLPLSSKASKQTITSSTRNTPPSTSTSTTTLTTTILLRRTHLPSTMSTVTDRKIQIKQVQPTQKIAELVDATPSSSSSFSSRVNSKKVNRTDILSTKSPDSVTRFSEIPRTVRYIKGVPIEPVNSNNSSYVIFPE